MGYRTVVETATDWGVSPRRVHSYLRAGRVAGAVRFGAAWMIPSGVQKPSDPRREKKPSSFAAELDDIIAATSAFMPRHNPDAILDAVSDERLRPHYEGELAYLRGDYERVVHLFRKISKLGDATKLRACPLTIATAISQGDFGLYHEIETWLKNIIQADLGAGVTAIAELSLDTAYTGAVVPALVSGWLRDGDFSALTPPARYDAAYIRAKYFQCVKKYESMLDVAETALAIYDSERGVSLPSINLRMARVLACCQLNRFDEAKRYLMGIVKMCLPHGFITPFVETVLDCEGLLEQCLRREFPAYRDEVEKRWKPVTTNWVAFHNRLTQENIMIALPLRETQMFALAARGVPYREIAERFGLSIGRVYNIMREIYGQAAISGKKEAAQLVMRLKERDIYPNDRKIHP